MKIAITGHTSGLGKEMFEHYVKQGHTVLGLSRSNGFDIINKQDEIITAIDNFDLFINNTHADESQLSLLDKAVNKVSKIVVIGSALHLYRDIATFEYLEQKQRLSYRCKMLNIDPSILTKILHVNISFLENKDKGMISDNAISYKEILSVIDNWLDNPVLTDVTFAWKLTPVVLKQLQQIIPNLQVDFL
jgi:hypothetical protein